MNLRAAAAAAAAPPIPVFLSEGRAFPYAGFVFNPLSVYFCLDEAEDPTAVIYEVRNTFGDAVASVRPAGPPAGSRR